VFVGSLSPADERKPRESGSRPGGSVWKRTGVGAQRRESFAGEALSLQFKEAKIV
jgi:hypothetical protein